MPSNDITEMRNHLFAALRGLTDKEAPMDIDRARAVSDISQTLINSAKVEVDYLKVTGARGSGFIPEVEVPKLPASSGGDPTSMAGQLGVSVRRHKLQG